MASELIFNSVFPAMITALPRRALVSFSSAVSGRLFSSSGRAMATVFKRVASSMGSAPIKSCGLMGTGDEALLPESAVAIWRSREALAAADESR